MLSYNAMLSQSEWDKNSILAFNEWLLCLRFKKIWTAESRCIATEARRASLEKNVCRPQYNADNFITSHNEATDNFTTTYIVVAI